MIYISDELSHYGVKGMKWGIRNEDRHYADGSRARALGYRRAARWQKKSEDQRLSVAQRDLNKALGSYSKINKKYSKRYSKLYETLHDESSSQKQKDKISKKLDKTYTKEELELARKVTAPLKRKGYDYVSFNAGLDFIEIQAGRNLAKEEKTQYGERYVDEFFIDTIDRKVFRLDD